MSKAENVKQNIDPETRAMWSELETTHGPEDVGGVEMWEFSGITPKNKIPTSLRLNLPTGIAHDFMREDIHNKLVQDEFNRGVAQGAEIEKAAHGQDLFWCAFLGILAGFAAGTALWWGLAQRTAEHLSR